MLKHRSLGLIITVVIFLGLTACGSDGTCLGTGGVVNVCKEGWTAEECADWDDKAVNGSSWSFYSDSSCESLGYPIKCDDGSWVSNASICG